MSSVVADAAGWIALAATCVAALMTAANLGARVTGWGFVIFTIGATAWIVVGVATNQTQLLYSNIFLGIVDVFGIWRWLGRRAKIDDASHAEEQRSRNRTADSLFSVMKLDGLPVRTSKGEIVAHATDALISCSTGAIDYLVVRTGGIGGIGETLRRLPWSDAAMHGDGVCTKLTHAQIGSLQSASTE